MPLGVDGQQDLGRVPLAPRWRRVGSGPSARQVRPLSAGSLVSAWRVSPVKGQELPRQRGPRTRECLRAGPCGGLCGKAGRQEAGPGLSVRLRCLPWPAAAPPEPPLSSEPWGWGSLPTPPRPRVMPPSTPLASPPAAHPGGTSRRVSGRVVLRWLRLGTLLTAPWGPACWRSCPWLSGGRGAPGLAAPAPRVPRALGPGTDRATSAIPRQSLMVPFPMPKPESPGWRGRGWPCCVLTWLSSPGSDAEN